VRSSELKKLGTFGVTLFEFLWSLTSEFHDQGDAKWIVIRRQLRGHNDTPFGGPIPGQPIGCPGVGRPKGVIDVFHYYQLSIFFFYLVPLILELTNYTLWVVIPCLARVQ
jgi:hypothetical protein